ncbi:MAG TPA: aldehyde reductase [Minicystis sp.]|nr:aldehyde reductase [Minicystis sp.]
MSNPATHDLVLVTGATGFVAMHLIVKLLRAGHRVRGTLRDLRRAERLARVLAEHAGIADVSGQISFVEADLGRDEGWAEAAAGCRYVLHVASPVLAGVPKDADDVIRPAREGTLRVLRAAADAGVARVVMTSSVAAVLYGHPRDGGKTYDEDDWTILGEGVAPYEQSKTLAERAAWDFVASLPEGRRFELVTLLPGLILGPVLDKDFSVSGEVVKKLLAREVPGCPDLGWAVVDVRDVADAHVAAMTAPDAAGKRFVLAIEHANMIDVAKILDRRFGPEGYRVPVRRVPNLALRVVALFDGTVALAVPDLGKRQDVSSARARAVLGFRPRTLEQMVVDMGESMIRLGVVPPPKRRRARAGAAAAPAR